MYLNIKNNKDMKTLFVALVVCMTCAITTYAQLPDGYSVGVQTTTTDNTNDETLSTNTKTNVRTKGKKNYIERFKEQTYKRRGEDPGYISTTTTVTGATNHTSGVFKKDPVIVQDNGSGVMIAGMIINTGLRVASMFMPNNGGYYNGGYFGPYNTMYMNNVMGYPGYRIW